MLKASTMKPRTTFTELSHPPDLGSPFSQEGNMANRVKGMAKARANPNIPRTGSRASPPAASTSRAPTMGPVQEKETSTVVRARKKAPPIPPRSARLSALFTHLEGRTSSYMPKKAKAKKTNSAKKITLGIQWVLSALAALGPTLVRLTMTPRAV